jgi:hypothetical protein
MNKFRFFSLRRRSLVFGRMYVSWPSRLSRPRRIWSELSPACTGYSARGGDDPGPGGPKCCRRLCWTHKSGLRDGRTHLR